MRPIDRSEVLPIGEYEQVRARFRARVIDEKRHRRVTVGPHMSVVFENRDTALLQIQEMLRAERITKESSIQHEIDTYNDLIPGDDELSMTLFIEIVDAVLREKTLIDLRGLEEKVGLEVNGVLFGATHPPHGVMPDRTTAVHYFKVKLSTEARQAIHSKSATLAVRVDHPQYAVRVELPRAVVASLSEDFS
ncbi:MAG: DUF3501 family protein [Polyangiaceae bacterium]|nr:DUF3501 family protein [Polyangiaceae bacterium]